MQRMMGNRVRRLVMSSALAGAAFVLAGPAVAQDYGLLALGDGNAGVYAYINPAGATLQGNLIGLYANGVGIELENFGAVRGNSPGHAGILFDQGDSIIFNYGLVSGAGFGITTSSWYNPATGLFEGRATNSLVLNYGTIIGDSNDGVRLIGGGEVLNLGTIEGRAGGGADGISMFAHAGQNTSGRTFIGVVVNAGTIVGNRFGVIQSVGGVVQNGGSISGNVGGVSIQDGLNDGGKVGLVDNSGSITGGSGVSFGVHLVSSRLTNSGNITGTATAGIENLGPNPLTIDNQAVGTITGTLKGIHAVEGAVIVTNAGTIRGNGTYDGFEATPDGGISIGVAGSSITNSGSISGARFGITTYNYYNAQSGQLEPRAVGTVVTNLAGGSIIGEGDDGVRLIGGGTVTNAGLIEGRAFVRAEGVSMFALQGQDTSGQTSIGTVINLAGGSIIGNRFGIGLSGGGVIENAGLVQGADFSAGSFDPYGAGVLLQSSPIEPGKTGTLSNSGTVIGGHGVLLGGTLASTLINNSGTITGTQASGIYNASGGIATVNNGAGGSISGALKGIHAGEAGVIVNNAGTIRGNGTYDGFDATPDGGISIGVGGSSITNSGSISGARFGITTYNYYNAQSGQLEPRAVGTVVNNLAGGSIIGEGDDGVRLIGGGTVTNAGLIEGRSFQFADGVSMFALGGQNTTGQTGMGTVSNQAGGTIFGNRFGVALSGGGVIDNAGTILASDFSTGSLDGFGGGVLFQAAALEVGKIGSLDNSGIISGGNGVIFGAFLASGTLANSGSITGTQAAGVHNSGVNAISVDNLAGGSIAGQRMGVWGQNGAVTITNAGTISGQGGGNNGAIVIEQGGSSVSNSGLIQGSNFGITANPFFNSVTGLNEARATNTGVTNSGTIRGLTNDGVRLQGGGTVTNSGLIEAVADPFNRGADGVSMLAINGQNLAGITSIGTVNNLAGGSIIGARAGIILSVGGTVNNAGSIRAPDFTSVSLDGLGTGVIIQDAAGGSNKIGTLANSGSITGGNAVTFGGSLASGLLSNSGSIAGRVGQGVQNLSTGELTIDNQAGGSISGATWGILGRNGAIVLANAGTITGTGIGQAAIQIEQAGSSVNNSGLIEGANYGITTASFVNASGVNEGRAIGTVVENSGTIRGQNNDGVRLVGGGDVTNSGLIEGLTSAGADGVSIFTHSGQNTAGFSSMGTVDNQAGGSIFGNRFGIIMSTGGVVNNVGTISGNGGGISIQDGLNDGGKTGTVANAGSISGGSGVSFGVNLVSSLLTNSGSITGTATAGVQNLGANPVTIDNQAGGSIVGALKGVHAIEGAANITNAGSIRGNGTYDGFQATPDAGISIGVAGTRIVNSGSISGARFGITTYNYFNAQTGLLEPRAVGTFIGNAAAGSIIGDSDDGVRLIGGGHLANQGVIEGRVGPFADGVSMFALEGQTLTSSMIGIVENFVGGTIAGNRFGVILSGGGYVWNAGTIRGNIGGLLIQAANVPGTFQAGLINTGSIENGVLLNSGLSSAYVENAGTISSWNAAVPAFESLSQTFMANAGRIDGGTGTALRFGDANDELVLVNGSQIIGLADGGSGTDLLRAEVRNGMTNTLGRFTNFETLWVYGQGTWAATDATGSFNSIDIFDSARLLLTGSLSGAVTTRNGGIFQIGAGGGVDGFTGNISNNGRVIVDIGSDYSLASVISGTGTLQKFGPGRLTLTAASSYTGATTVSGGTLAVDGSIVSPVTVQAGGALGGTGSVANVTVLGGGALAPGNGIGTLTVNGTLALSSGARFEVDANAAGQADRVNVVGSATIASNVIVNVTAANGTWNPATKYVILNASGKITGLFAGVTSDLVFLDPKLGQTSKAVELTLKRNNNPLTATAATTSQASVAAAVETMGDTGLLQQALLSQNLAGAQMAFDTLSGNFFGSLSNQLVASAGRLQSLLQPQGEMVETGIAAWSALMPATRSASSADYRSGFSLAGNGFSLSMAAGWLPQERMARSSAGMASMETHYSGTMLGYADGGLRVSAGAGFSWHRIVADRSVSFPGFADGNQARYRGATRQLFAEVAHNTSLGPVALTPFAGYSNIRVAGMDIREAGGGTGLIIDGQARQLGLAQVGLRSRASLPLAIGMRLSARFDMAWQRAWGDLASVQNSRFASNGAGFVYRGQELGRGGLDIDAGLTLERGRLAFTAGYRRNSLLQRFDDGAEFGMRLQF